VSCFRPHAACFEVPVASPALTVKEWAWMAVRGVRGGLPEVSLQKGIVRRSEQNHLKVVST
jgi:hypothetical protein